MHMKEIEELYRLNQRCSIDSHRIQTLLIQAHLENVIQKKEMSTDRFGKSKS